MTKKQGIRAVAFMIVLLAVLWWWDGHLRFNSYSANQLMTQRFQELYSDEKNTWDGVMIGSSSTDRAWAAPAAWEKYGMTLYALSTNSEPFVLVPNIIEEVVKYQDVSYAVIELHGLSSENLGIDAVKIRRITDNMKRSANWADTIQAGMTYMEKYNPEEIEEKSPYLSMYIPIMKYHSRLTTEDVTLEELFPPATEMKGVFNASQSKKVKKVKVGPHDNYPEVTELQKELLENVFTTAEKYGIDLYFVNIAIEPKEQDFQDTVNAAAKYVQERGYPVLDFSREEVFKASGLSGKKDFYDCDHMNARGARKFTEYLSAWLQENREIPDHRGDEKYKSWDSAAEKYDAFYEDCMKALEKK